VFEKTSLKNGIRVIVSPMPQVKSVTVLILVRTGSRYETAENNGVSHFLEHMMFKGTKKRPTPMEISTIIDSVGGAYNAFTSKIGIP
jgi:predicted Zn-dependent peptidase